MDGNKELNYRDFPVNRETSNLGIWKHLDIGQKGKLDILEGEEIYEGRMYPVIGGKDKVRILSKVCKKTKNITYVVFSRTITTEENIVTKEEYQKMVSDFEYALSDILDIEKKQVMSGKMILIEL